MADLQRGDVRVSVVLQLLRRQLVVHLQQRKLRAALLSPVLHETVSERGLLTRVAKKQSDCSRNMTVRAIRIQLIIGDENRG